MASLSKGSGASNARRLGILRLAVTGALAGAIFFALCWAAAALGLTGATHMYILLFTYAEPSSGLALVQGVGWSLLLGFVGGALIAFLFNALRVLDGR